MALGMDYIDELIQQMMAGEADTDAWRKKQGLGQRQSRIPNSVQQADARGSMIGQGLSHKPGGGRGPVMGLNFGPGYAGLLLASAGVMAPEKVPLKGTPHWVLQQRYPTQPEKWDDYLEDPKYDYLKYTR
jgi:hypothetical protein